MPYRKTPLINNHFYHIYNRGVEKRKIFMNHKDYLTFLQILRWYLKEDMERPVLSKIPKKSLKNTITLYCYCLMPNHFHFLACQNQNQGITDFMRAFATTYAMYFNHKYERVGSLFQGRFQAKLIETEKQFLYISKYIHTNPLEILAGKNLASYSYSSYPEYIDKKKKGIVPIETGRVLSYFSKKFPQIDYKSFVEEVDIDFEEMSKLIVD